jgi:hypothetical protein
MRMGFISSLAILALGAWGSTVAAPEDDSWPQAGQDPGLRAMIDSAGYSQQEQHNIRTILTVLSHPEGLAAPNRSSKYFAVNYQAKGLKPYYVLDRAYGKEGGQNAQSVSSVVRRVKNLLANGDRVWLYMETTAAHTGMLYGVQGSGKPIVFYESMFVRFDPEGRIAETYLIAQQGELYRQLGGQFVFPGRPQP